MPRTYNLWSTVPGSSGVVSCGEHGVGRATRAHGVEQADHLEVILGVALVVLLAARLSDARLCRHVDARLRAGDTRRPRALRARDVAVRVELGGPLAEVPDVAVRVLAVPVGGALLEVPVEIEEVTDGDAAARRRSFGSACVTTMTSRARFPSLTPV